MPLLHEMRAPHSPRLETIGLAIPPRTSDRYTPPMPRRYIDVVPPVTGTHTT